jgi:hypothetical protein
VEVLLPPVAVELPPVDEAPPVCAAGAGSASSDAQAAALKAVAVSDHAKQRLEMGKRVIESTEE